MEDKIRQFREWLVQNRDFYESGEMCSLSESIHGAGNMKEVIAKFDEVFEGEK